ncbi:MAG: MBL fold metallo-hydrolase [Leptospiraceae bacterium]|nr:MBL fold metallo-hydrolase [Leptospiraceae bacterium]
MNPLKSKISLHSFLLLAFLFFAGLTYINCASFGQSPEGLDQERLTESPRYQEDHFVNVHPRPEGPSFFSVAWEWLWSDGPALPENPIPVQSRTARDFDEPPADGLRITWFGHSSVLLEMDGSMVLIDPVWSRRVSPVSFLGPARFHEPPMSLEELTKLPIDVVLISHDHYDHLDYETILALQKTGARFVVPLGVGSHLRYWGIEPDRIDELDWWQEVKVGTLRFVATPAQHFSGRTLEDRDATLWSSWAILGPRKKAFYSGDTGYFEGFREIGERLGPFDLSIMAVGAYDKRWAFVHLNPEEAVQAHLDVRANHFFPVHWGTFNLAFHDWTDPAERTLQAARDSGVSVWTPAPGQILQPPVLVATERWWDSTVRTLVERLEERPGTSLD